MKQIIIIGGGYAGVSALRELTGTKNIKITLIDTHPYHFLQTEGYELIANTIPFDETIVNLVALCHSYGDHVNFIHDLVTKVNFEEKTLMLEESGMMEYDYLIVAAGSRTKFFESKIEGLRSFSHGIKSLRGAIKMKQFFEKELYSRLENEKQSDEVYSVIIGGAGLSGVEIAAEMRHYFNRYYRSNTLACATLKIHLISGSPTILKGCNAQVIKKAQKRLDDLGVITHAGSHIERVKLQKTYLASGDVVPFDFIIFTGGIHAAPLVREMDLEKNGMKQIIVDAYLQIPGKKDAFAIGDAAEMKDKNGIEVSCTAQASIKSGIAVAHNLKQILKGKEPKKVDINIQGLAIALGGKYAILDVGKFRLSGFSAYYIKKFTEKIYKWPLWLRCKYGFSKVSKCKYLN